MENLQAIERSTVKKTMSRILPFILLLYVIAHLDRVNLGYAALEMNADLALTAEVFGLLSGIFFIGYFMFEIPSNMLLHKVGAKAWIARIMISWGIIVILTGFVQSATHLYILRFLLGIAEAGFFPGAILYLTYWFRKKERGRATAVLLLAIPLGGLIGAPVSAFIIDNVFWANLAGWRWMFILEGIPAVVLGMVVIFYLVNNPAQAKWLTTEEKKWLASELQKEQRQSSVTNKVSTKEMIKDLNVWKLALVYFTNYTCMFGLSFWMPTILKNLSAAGTTNMDIGWLAMIPPLVGIPSILFAGWNSDRTGKYKEHIIASFAIGALGFLTASFISSPGLMVVFLTVASLGLYLFAGCFFAYATHFFTEKTAPVGIALVNSFAALGGFIGPYLLGVFSLSMGMSFLAALSFVGLVILFTLKRRADSTEIELQEILDLPEAKEYVEAK
ncbi:MAG TPA: MFS transporter [Ureibacillus sp.]|nr:MFS transporter [Ureibacillus sp.]